MNLEKIKSIGFDLDGTLYPSTNEIDGRIRNKIAEKILQKIPKLQTKENARNFFEEKYKELHSGSNVLEYVGYLNSSKIMDQCLAEADVLDLIEPNKRLFEIFKKLKEKYEVYLLTSSPKDLSIKKLKRLLIDENIFDFVIYGDSYENISKLDGTGFKKAIIFSKFKPEFHLYIGDREKTDILPAMKLGMQTLLVASESNVCKTIKNINEIKYFLL
jgi:FMN phosphatase YigB (HAD superfamily)